MSQPRRSPSPTIGALNGPWAMTLKIVLATYPIVLVTSLSWAVWVTVSIYETKAFIGGGGERITQKDLRALKSEITLEQPSLEWKTKVSVIERDVRNLTVEQAKILAILERFDKSLNWRQVTESPQ